MRLETPSEVRCKLIQPDTIYVNGIGSTAAHPTEQWTAVTVVTHRRAILERAEKIRRNCFESLVIRHLDRLVELRRLGLI